MGGDLKEANEGGMWIGISETGFPDIRKSKCKDPAVVVCLTCDRSSTEDSVATVERKGEQGQ